MMSALLDSPFQSDIGAPVNASPIIDRLTVISEVMEGEMDENKESVPRLPLIRKGALALLLFI